jgi:hypothetical protein
MADKKARIPRVVTPAGIAVYPWLNKPDTKFEAEGTYKISLRVAATEAAPLIEKLEAKLEEVYIQKLAEWGEMHKAKGKKAPQLIRADLPIDEEEGGTFLFKFKMKASGIRKDGTPWKQQPALFDAKGLPLEEGTEVWGGSTVKVAFQPTPFLVAGTKTAGLSFKLNAVQVLKLVRSGGTADSYGFSSESEEEEDYEAPEKVTTEGAEDEDF